MAVSSTPELLARLEPIERRYQSYLEDEEGGQKVKRKSDDAFSSLYMEIDANIGSLNEKAEDAKQEKKRAEAAKKNSEIRVAKENLKKKLPELRQLAQNGKKLTEEDIQGRHESVDDLERRIENIPDGLNRSKFGKEAMGHRHHGSQGKNEINFTDIEMQIQKNQTNMEHTEQSRQFQREWQESKARQDEGLEEISKGLGTLKNLANEMGDEVQRQQPIIENLDHKADKATSEMRTVNTRMKEAVTSLRSNRNIIIDILLVIILLGLGGYIFSVAT